MSNKNLELALRIRADLNQAIRQLDQMEGALDDTRGAADRLQQKNTELSTGFNKIAASVKAVTLTLGVGFGLKEITRSADAWTAYENRLRLVTSTQLGLQQASQDVYNIARNTSQLLDATAAVYQRFAQNAERLNITQKQTAQLTDTVSKAIAISGGAAASGEAALVQFGQALASGVLRGEEFNSVMEQAPGLALALANGLDVDIGKLRDMANAGELTTDKIVEALTKAQGFVDTQFETRIKTIAQGATELNSALTRLIGTLANTNGTSTALTGALSAVTDVIDSLAENTDILGAVLDTALVLTAGRALIAITGMTKAKVKAILTTRADIAAELTAANAHAASTARQLASARATGVATAAVTAHTAALQRQAAAQAAASVTAGGMLGLLGGPAGMIALTAVAATGLYAFRDSTDDVQSSLANLNEPLDQVVERLRDLTEVERQQELTRLSEKIDQLKDRAINAARELSGFSIAQALGGGNALSGEALTQGSNEALLQLRQAAADTAAGIAVDFDKVGETIRTSGDITDETRQKMLDLLEALIKQSREVETHEQRYNDLTSALNETSSAAVQVKNSLTLSPEAAKAADAYLASLQKQFEQLQNLTIREQALGFIRKNSIDVNSDLAQNILALAAANDALKESQRNNDGESRATRLAKINTELDNQLERMYMLRPEREAQAEFDRIEERLLGRKIELEEKEAKALQNKITQIRAASRVQAEMDRIYNSTVTVHTRYKASLRAADQLLARGVITREQYNRELVKSREGYLNELDPLRQINKQIEDQARLLKLPQKEREIEQQMIQLTNQLLQEGIDLRQDESTATQLRSSLQANQQLSEDQKRQEKIKALIESMPGFDPQMDFLQMMAGELRRVWDDTAGALEALQGRLFALTAAFHSGAITVDYYNNQIARLNVESAELLNTLGFGNEDTMWVQALGHLLDDFTTVQSGLADILGQSMDGWVDGLADGLARAVVEGESLRDILGNVARTVATDMLRALIKLGIQYMINNALADASLTANVASQTAAAAQVSSAWSPAAALASLATSGANATSANAAIISTMAITEGLASQAFAEGGYTGPGAKYDVAGIVHAGEYVQPQHRMREPGALEFMEAFRTYGMQAVSRFQGYADGGSVGSGQLSQPITPAAPGGTALQVINVLDTDEMADKIINSGAGTRSLVNVIRSEKSQIKAILES